MRRRALLAANASSGGTGSGWTYELHLTPEWDFMKFYYEARIMDDFTELFDFLGNMITTLGDDTLNRIELFSIPTECNITIDGERLTNCYLHKVDPNVIHVVFGDYYCSGTLSETRLSLDREMV